MDITGIVRVYKNEYEGRETYQTTISKKDQYGNYENMYISLQLPQGTSLDNNTKINVTKGFLSFYKTRQGLPKIKVVVLEFTKVEETAPKQQQTPNSYEQQALDYYDSQANYYGDDLPF